MEWTLASTLIFVVLLQRSICSSPCPALDTRPSHVGIANPGNFTGDCPVVTVDTESQCLAEFCRIYTTKGTCHGNAVQITNSGNTTLCYIMELRHSTMTVPVKPDPFSSLFVMRPSAMTTAPEAPETSEECDPDLHFQCKRDGMCIALSMRCDGELTCSDGSDEMGCKQYLNTRTTDQTMLITAIAVGAVLSLLLIVLMFACGQRLYASHYDRRRRLRNLRLGSSGADYVVRLLPGEAPFQDTLPPSYTDSILLPSDEPPIYEPLDTRDRLLDLDESSSEFLQQSDDSIKAEEVPSASFTEPGPSFDNLKLDGVLQDEVPD